MIYNIIAGFFCIVIPIFFAFEKENHYEGITKEWLRNNSFNIIVYLLLILGFGLRLINIQNFPNALNCDEASSRI